MLCRARRTGGGRTVVGVSLFVVVHGAWGGGWEWAAVAGALRDHGHEVHTPTLTGLGDRAHLGLAEPIGLSTHVADVVSVLEMEDLEDVVLCGASYGGMPVTGAADQASERVARVVYVDALVPHDGRSALDLLPSGFGAQVRAGLAEHGSAWRVPLPAALWEALMPAGEIDEGRRQRYRARVRDHPAASFTEAVRLDGAVDRIPRAFVRCTGGRLVEAYADDPIERCAERARAEGWAYRELETGHDPQVFDPEGLARCLDALVAEG